jgi:hypothetical protein
MSAYGGKADIDSDILTLRKGEAANSIYCSHQWFSLPPLIGARRPDSTMTARHVRFRGRYWGEANMPH